MLGLASKSKLRRDFSRGKISRLDPPLRLARGPVVALGHQQFGEEAAVGHLVLDRPVGDVGELVADRRQPQQVALLVSYGFWHRS